MDSKFIDLDKQIKTAFIAVKNDISSLKKFQDGITKATANNKKIFSDVIRVIDTKINDISSKISKIDDNLGKYNDSIKKLDEELYKNDIDVQKIKLEQEKLVKFKHAVDEQVKIKKDLYDIVEKFELKFGELDEMQKSLQHVEQTNMLSINAFKDKLEANYDEVKRLYDAINDKMLEVNSIVDKMTQKFESMGHDFINKKELSSELTRVSKAVSDEIDVIYTKHLNVFEKELSRFKEEVSIVKSENNDLKKIINELNAKNSQLVAESVSRDSFVGFQQENFNNILKVTNLLKESIGDSSKATTESFKNFAKDHQRIVNEIYDELMKMKTKVVDKTKFEKAVDELNKTLYKYYKSNLELTKLDVSYSNDEEPKTVKSFEKYFSYEELDEQRNHIETIQFEQPNVNIQPVEVKTSIASHDNVVSTSQPTKKRGFFKFVSNLFFDEIDVEEDSPENIDALEMKEDKIVDLTDKVASAEEITIEIEPTMTEVKPKVVTKPKSTKVVSKKVVKKSSSKKASPKTVKKVVKKAKKSSKKKDDVEVINLYD